MTVARRFVIETDGEAVTDAHEKRVPKNGRIVPAKIHRSEIEPFSRHR
jgi:hypothetical protein